MKRKTQVPARIIAECTTRKQRAEVEQMFIRLYDEYMQAEHYHFQDTDGAYLPDEKGAERAAWKQVELRLLGGV